MAVQPELKKKILPIIYIIDSSGSMEIDGNMTKVNEAIKEAMVIIQAKAAASPDADVMVGALKFSTGAEWVFDGLKSPNDFFWNDIKAAGMTYLGAALDKLDAKLSTEGFLDAIIGYKCPVLIFMSDGHPNDPGDTWKKSLEDIKKNKWFRNSIKIAMAVGDAADKDVLLEVIDNNREGLIEITDTDKLKELIVAVSVRSFKVGSTSKNAKAGNDASEIVKKTVQGAEGVIVGDTNNIHANEPTTSNDTVMNGVDPNSGYDDGGWK